MIKRYIAVSLSGYFLLFRRSTGTLRWKFSCDECGVTCLRNYTRKVHPSIRQSAKYKMLSGAATKKQFEIRSMKFDVLGQSGRKLLRALTQSSRVLRSDPPACCACWNYHPSEFSQRLNQFLNLPVGRWEKAEHSVRETALKYLNSTTDIRKRVSQISPRINNIVNRIKCMSFSRMLLSQLNLLS